MNGFYKTSPALRLGLAVWCKELIYIHPYSNPDIENESEIGIKKKNFTYDKVET